MDSTANLSYKGYLEFLNWFLSTKSKYVFDKEPWQINSFAKLISEFSLIHNKVIKEDVSKFLSKLPAFELNNLMLGELYHWKLS